MPDFDFELDLDTAVFSTTAHIITREEDTGQLDTRAVDTKLLELARKRAPDPTVFDDNPPFTWRNEISSDVIDAYYTIMDPETTLPNFARDAEEGVAVLIGHNTHELPIGASLTGTLEKKKSITRVLSDAYTLVEQLTEHIVNRIRAGIAKDNSVGFNARRNGAKCICSICGLDMWRDWWECRHIPGFEYEETTEGSTGTKGKKRMVLCTGKIINGSLSEYSLVYDGATPGASVLQAQRAAVGGWITPQQARVVELRHRIRLPDRQVTVAVPSTITTDPGAVLPSPEEIAMAIRNNGKAAAPSQPADTETPETETDTTERAAPAEQPETPAKPAGKSAPATQPIEARLRPILARAGAPSDLLVVEAVAWMADELERLQPKVKDGEKYREDLIEDALREGVRALTASFKEETYRSMFEEMPIEIIRQMRDDWKVLGDQRISSGRKSVDGSDPKEPNQPDPAPRGKRRPPSGAFRT